MSVPLVDVQGVSLRLGRREVLRNVDLTFQRSEIVSLLVTPAAAARQFATTPERMALVAALVGTLSVAGGLQASLVSDTPLGASIVCAAALLFLLSLLTRLRTG